MVHSMDSLANEQPDLIKENRILQKQLTRSEADRVKLEENLLRTESLLKKVIADLQQSKQDMEVRSQALETALLQLQKAQTQLIESEKMSALGVLVAGVAHEINNPINFVHGNLSHAEAYIADLLSLVDCYGEVYPNPDAKVQDHMEQLELDFLREDLQKLLKSMKVGTERILGIVQSLRTFSRLDEADFKIANLHDGLESTLVILQNRLKPSSGFPGVKVMRDYGDLPEVYCYPGKLNQVFMNLLLNAIDALEESWETEPGPDAPTIWVTTAIESEAIVIRFSDNGPGIPEAIRSRLFEPFFTTKPVGRGTGLGLSISYQIIVQEHQGQLICESQFGEGTKFILRIPAKTSDETRETNSP